MKKTISVMAAVVFAFTAMSFTTVNGQNDKIKVNGNCGMCKAKIENAAKTVEGVKTAVWDAKTKELTVDFDEKVTDVAKISNAVAKIGYDAGQIKADKEAREKLPACCKGESGDKHGSDKGCNKSCDHKNSSKQGCEK